MIGGRGGGESDTDLVLAAAAIAAAATAAAAFWLLQLAFWIASGISATATWPTLADLAAVLGLHLLSDAEHATAVDGARGLFWVVAAVLETSLILILVVGGLASWRRWGPTPAGTRHGQRSGASCPFKPAGELRSAPGRDSPRSSGGPRSRRTSASPFRKALLDSSTPRSRTRRGRSHRRRPGSHAGSWPRSVSRRPAPCCAARRSRTA
ncbi:hypothetical protein Ae168Ps1_6247c [Pseudonocardia sp. Ae168_Ps1]|nr:hypothetical protein Ae168Ps1_6247c [Pseudonocardia sp. Ae168_Ps1]OLL71619.1 hypothetical protein Ae263Ps1_6107c [Pseudonocardia sp. Ae263_Ps1]